MNKLVVGGLAFLVGCVSPDPKLAQEMAKLNTTLDRLVRVASYHDAALLMTQRDYEGAIAKYTIAIKKQDAAIYRIARFQANRLLARSTDDAEKKQEAFEACIEDADTYIDFLPDEPDGYIAKALALYDHFDNGGTPQDLATAHDLVLKARTLVFEHNKQYMHFTPGNVEALNRKLIQEYAKHEKKEY